MEGGDVLKNNYFHKNPGKKLLNLIEPIDNEYFHILRRKNVQEIL
jgi:hypothetical protein